MNKNELKDWCDGARRALDKERERIIEKLEMVDGLVQTMEAVDEIQTENESLKTEKEGIKNENEGLRNQVQVEKRIAVKEMVLEMANANGVVLPEDLAATIDALDDEQLDARVVNVQGNYNDIHDNTKVNIKDKEE